MRVYLSWALRARTAMPPARCGILRAMPALRSLARGLGLALAVGGCAASMPASPEAPAAPPPAPLTQARIVALIGEIAALRGLPQRAPVPVYLLDGARFRAALQERAARIAKGQAIEARVAFHVAFDLLPRGGPGQGRPSTVREVLEEQIVGFYDRDRRHIVVRATSPRTEAEAEHTRGVLAHEITHALQDQNFGLLQASSDLPMDQALARAAVVEGDAMLTMAAYLARERGMPFNRVVRRTADLTRDVPIERFMAGDDAAALRNALPIVRERLLFPYQAGAGLAADLYRAAAGLSLVNGLFSRPPVSTEQVLHPEKYLAGELPIFVGVPEPPPGWRAIASETLGELQTRVVLERCTTAARAAAEGWGGDRFTLLAGAGGALALLWSTAWDSDADAAEFARAMQGSPDCLRPITMNMASIDGTFVVQLEGRKVAVVRGLSEPLARAQTARLLALPAQPAPPVPIGAYRIPPRDPLPTREPGTVAGNVFVSRWLGVAGLIPDGLGATLGPAGLELKIAYPGVAGGFAVSDRLTSPRHVENVFDEIMRGFAGAAEGEPLVLEGGGPAWHPLGPAVDRWWSVGGTPFMLRAIVVPICSGTGSYVFIQSWSVPGAKSALDQWMSSFRWTSPGRPPLCEVLDPR